MTQGTQIWCSGTPKRAGMGWGGGKEVQEGEDICIPMADPC